jgi:hypothetical protein
MPDLLNNGSYLNVLSVKFLKYEYFFETMKDKSMYECSIMSSIIYLHQNFPKPVRKSKIQILIS